MIITVIYFNKNRVVEPTNYLTEEPKVQYLLNNKSTGKMVTVDAKVI